MGGYGEGVSNNPSHSNHKSGLRQDFLAVLWRNLDRRICSDTIFGAKRTPPWVKPQAAWLVSFRILVRILLLFISRVTALYFGAQTRSWDFLRAGRGEPLDCREAG